MNNSVWILWTKCDQIEEQAKEDLTCGIPSQRSFAVSVLHSVGIEELRVQLEEWALSRETESASVASLTSARCATALEAGREALSAASDACQNRLGDELVAGNCDWR